MPQSFSSSASSSALGAGTVTLADIERELAPRVGPYSQRTVASGTASTMVITALASSLSLGGVKDLWVLRRGKLTDGTAVPGFVVGDRQRIVTLDPDTSGTVIPDRAWATAPVVDEVVEFHHLDPEQELRPAVRAGLRRCFFEDRAALTLSSTATERDLTALAFWITDPKQVYRVQSSPIGSYAQPPELQWARPFSQGGHVWLAGSPDPYPDTLLVTARRAHFTFVNGADSTTGPTADDDVLAVDLLYATSAAHAEAWRLIPDRLRAAANEGLQVSQQEAADEFTRQARLHWRPPARRVSFMAPYGVNSVQRV